MITVATLFWDSNQKSFHYSTMYDESWVEKLYRGFARNLTMPFRFVCFTEKGRAFKEPIEQKPLKAEPDYADCIEPYKLNEPMILVGLDTVITGNIDHLAAYCLASDKIAVPRDPFYPDKLCNGVALVPGGMRAKMYDAFPGGNDMDWIRSHEADLNVIDDIWPGQVISYKAHAKNKGLGDARIVYFHGDLKANQLGHVGWVRRHWH